MAMFDKFKKSPPVGSEDASIEFDSDGKEISGFKRSALSRAATVMLAGSKKAADLVISRYRPFLQFDGILDPADIRLLVENRDQHQNISVLQLIVLSTNTLETLPLAFALRADLKFESKADIRAIGIPGSMKGIFRHTFLDENEDRQDGSKIKKQYLELIEDPKNSHLKEVIARIDKLLSLFTAMEKSQPKQVVSIADDIISKDSEFNHPLVARYLLSHFIETGADSFVVQKWCRSALFYWPLDPELLEIASEFDESSLNIVIRELNDINGKGIEQGERGCRKRRASI